MRFDDMLATVLARPLTNAAAEASVWRQLIDLVAQRGISAPASPRLEDAYLVLRQLREGIVLDERIEAARSVAGLRLPPALVAIFADDVPQVSAPVLAACMLAAEEWSSLLPRLSPTARAMLRNRRDLDAGVVAALASFGSSDFAIAARPAEDISPAQDAPTASEPAELADDPEPPTDEAGDAQIRELLARIDAFRRSPPPAEDEPEQPNAPPRVEDFRFETGPDGGILWVDGAPRSPIVGETLAHAGGECGVDGHAAGAFRRRAPFRDARLSVAGAGPAAGEWRISAVPFFQPGDGRFGGYRGTARRPRADETAAPGAEGAGLYGSGLPADSLRQLVHELRTPLSGIVGFAEMIERQLLGPAGAAYRTRAADILAQGRRLLAAIDDLDLAARVEQHRPASPATPVDAALLLARLHGDYDRVAAEHAVSLAFRIAPELPSVAADAVAVERMFARLLAATIGLAQAGERIVVTLDRDGEGRVRLAVARPRLIADREERTLLDPGYTPDGDWPDAPVLGLGFALRLVRNLALAAGGGLEIEPDSFVLRLPAGGGTARSGEKLG